MATVTNTKYLRMTFATIDPENDFLIRVDNPKDDLTAAEVQAAADIIIAKNVFSGAGNLLSLKDARILDNTVKDLI